MCSKKSKKFDSLSTLNILTAQTDFKCNEVDRLSLDNVICKRVSVVKYFPKNSTFLLKYLISLSNNKFRYRLQTYTIRLSLVEHFSYELFVTHELFDF